MGSNGPSWGGRIQVHAAARMLAIETQREADRLACRAWNIGLDQGVTTIQPSPTIGQAINGGFVFLRVHCTACKQHAHVDLTQVRRPAWTPVWQLEGMLACERCRGTGARAPRAVIDRLTTTKALSGWTG